MVRDVAASRVDDRLPNDPAQPAIAPETNTAAVAEARECANGTADHRVARGEARDLHPCRAGIEVAERWWGSGIAQNERAEV
jgi:hypothetical protein